MDLEFYYLSPRFIQSFQSKCAVGCFCVEFVFINAQMADRNEVAHDEAGNKTSGSPPASFEGRRLPPPFGVGVSLRKALLGRRSIGVPSASPAGTGGGIIAMKIYLGENVYPDFIYIISIFFKKKPHLFHLFPEGLGRRKKYPVCPCPAHHSQLRAHGGHQQLYPRGVSGTLRADPTSMFDYDIILVREIERLVRAGVDAHARFILIIELEIILTYFLFAC